MGEGSPSPSFRSLVMQLSPLSPGRDWPLESEDARKTSAWSAVQMIRVLLFLQMVAPEPDRDSDLPVITRGGCGSAKLLGSFLYTMP